MSRSVSRYILAIVLGQMVGCSNEPDYLGGYNFDQQSAKYVVDVLTQRFLRGSGRYCGTCLSGRLHAQRLVRPPGDVELDPVPDHAHRVLLRLEPVPMDALEQDGTEAGAVTI